MFRDESNQVKHKVNNRRNRPRVWDEVASTPPRRRSSHRGSSVPRSASTQPGQTSKASSPAYGESVLELVLDLRASSSPLDAATPSSREEHGHLALSQDAGFLPSSPPAPGKDLPWSLQEQGTAYFFSRYVANDNGCYQNYNFIYDVWKPPSPEAAHVDLVMASITAVGLTGLSKISIGQEIRIHLREHAWHSYGIALRLLGASLHDHNEAVSDQTMLAVLVLGTYELIDGRTPQTLEAWQKHVNGAATLASMRGTPQFATSAGTKMFLMLCHSVLISCVQSNLPVPQPILELRQKLGQMTDTTKPTWRMVDCTCRALQIRHDITASNVSDTDQIIDQLSDVEDSFADLIASLPRDWTYRLVQLAEPHPGVKGRWCHIYPGLAQATSWNAIRTVRMLIQETIVQQLNPGDGDVKAMPIRQQWRLAKALKLMELLQNAVTASIPQHFGIVTAKDAVPGGQTEESSDVQPMERTYHVLSGPSTSSQAPSPRGDSFPSGVRIARAATLLNPAQVRWDKDDDAEQFLALARASNTIVWPLYTVGMSSTCCQETRHYVVDRLDAIYSETGLHQARAVADKVRSKMHDSTFIGSLLCKQLPTIGPHALPVLV